jgi:hypothetical protein
VKLTQSIQAIKQGLEASGFKPEIQPLKYFEDDYGLKIRDNDGDDGDDNGDDDDGVDSGNEEYELVSEDDRDGADD